MQEADDMLIVTNKMTSTYTSLISKSNAKHVFKLHVPINNLLAMSSTNREKQVIIVI